MSVPLPASQKASLMPGARAFACAVLVLGCCWGRAEVVNAQVQAPFSGKYFPLDHTAPPGQAGLWSLQATRDAELKRGYFQPVRVELPTAGRVTFYAGSGEQTLSAPAPASAALLVGHLYRFKLSELEGYPGLVLYPTVELLDRLHPPAGKASLYPIPLTLTDEEILAVGEGRLVTKIVYIEQPHTAYVGATPDAVRNLRASARENMLAIADQHGRPVAILRVGGRVAAPHGEDRSFYGSGAPVKPVPVLK